MIINSLFIKDFRNIDELVFSCSPRLNIFIGPNGHGKTNIIEAIHLLVEKDSFRYGQNRTFIKHDKDIAFLNAKIQFLNRDFNIKYKIEKNRKSYLINEKSSYNFNNQALSLILFSPESLNIIKESSEQRRKLLDQTIQSIFPQAISTISEFNKVLKTRNKVLSDIQKEKIDFSEGLRILESLNNLFLKRATDLTCLRLEILKKIKDQVSLLLKQFEENDQVDFGYEYIISEEKCIKNDYDSIYKIMQKRMAELQKAELSSGISLVGPQKHDVIFLYNGNDSRYFSSQGQQRSIILAYKIAQIVYHYKVNENYPILLLDDVLSELDQKKQQALIKYLNTIETQTFLTATDLNSLKELNIENKFKYEIQNGKILNLTNIN